MSKMLHKIIVKQTLKFVTRVAFLISKPLFFIIGYIYKYKERKRERTRNKNI